MRAADLWGLGKGGINALYAILFSFHPISACNDLPIIFFQLIQFILLESQKFLSLDQRKSLHKMERLIKLQKLIHLQKNHILLGMRFIVFFRHHHWSFLKAI